MTSFTDFFTAYGRASLANDAEIIANCYAENFMAAGPSGNMTFKNDEKFTQWLEEMFKFNRKIGMQEMKVIKVETSPMGEYYTRALVRWGAVYSKNTSEIIEFEITYILYHVNDALKIIMYVSHENEEDVLKEKGIIP
ncbi:hypothetical protein SAMN05660461_1429 [Chitinophaga ginsengisegetis]|uniref:SnoaL-like domain-containing protein n=1 Tax=Chitinophaga ginsengisegetis TaxID=393003 RepID=A0A1T5NFW4_9BACT|nr:hypothetical protein [Chitinophaga ginsengisegetis]SKC99272.1 hypothetical protein SAMN05660461_1429 [Chitinophaga ginsengisegetis]